MTVSHRTPPLAAGSIASAVEVLRDRRLRVSAARRLVLEALFAAERPLTADEIAAGLEGWLPASDLASVYRNLDTLEEVGLVRHFHLGHGAGLYSLAAAGDLEFVTCESCGAFEAVAPSRLDGARDLIARELGYRARFSHFPIVGICSACLEPPAHSGQAHVERLDGARCPDDDLLLQSVRNKPPASVRRDGPRDTMKSETTRGVTNGR
jgi:Fur family ferric uptake transcriptional regulator